MNRSLKPVAFVLSLALLAGAAPAFAEFEGELPNGTETQQQPVQVIPTPYVYRGQAQPPRTVYRQADRGRNDRHRADDRASRPSRGQVQDYRVRAGSYLPPAYHQPRYVVNDWQRRHLSAPPRGYQWVQADSEVALVAIATGLILQVLLNH